MNACWRNKEYRIGIPDVKENNFYTQKTIKLIRNLSNLVRFFQREQELGSCTEIEKIWDKTKYLLWNSDPVCNGPIRITAVSLANLMRITNIKGMRARETTIIKYRLLFHKTQIKRRIDRLITFLWGRWSREGTGGRSRRGGRSDCWSSASWPPRPPCGSPWGRERTGRQG